VSGHEVPQVAVVIPTLGRSSVRRAVTTVVEQRAVEAEALVVVADPAALRPVKTHLSGLPARIIVAPDRCNASTARNLGVRSSDAPYIAFLDDDDWWEADKLWTQLGIATRMRRLPHVVASSRAYFHSSDGRLRIVPKQALPRNTEVASYLLRRARLRYGEGCLLTPTLLLNRELALLEPWDERLELHEDWDLLIRLISRNDTQLVMSPRPLTHVVQGSPESMSRRRDWRASLAWFDDHPDWFAGRSGGDFLASIALRSALASREFAGVSAALFRCRSVPHAAALFVGLSGLRSGGNR